MHHTCTTQSKLYRKAYMYCGTSGVPCDRQANRTAHQAHESATVGQMGSANSTVALTASCLRRLTGVRADLPTDPVCREPIARAIRIICRALPVCRPCSAPIISSSSVPCHTCRLTATPAHPPPLHRAAIVRASASYERRPYPLPPAPYPRRGGRHRAIIFGLFWRL
jgi:hypothetical protein